MQKRFLSLFILFALGVVWGSGYAIARFAMTHGVPPLGYTFWQSLGPAVILMICSYVSRKRLVLSGYHVFFYFLCGLIGIAIPNTNMYFASPHLSSGLLALIVNTVPIMIYPLALISRQEKFSIMRLLAIILAMIGILCLVLPKSSFPNFQQARWALFALITPFCFAIFATFINPRRPLDSTPLNLAAGMLAASTLLVAPLVFSTHSFYPLTWPFSLSAWIVILEMILSSLGYVLFFWLLKIAGPVYYSLVDGVVALTGLLWGVIIFGEHFNIWQGLAISLVLAAIALMTSLQNKPTQPSSIP